MTLLEFLILALATWRVSSLLADEEGPFKVFEWLRQRAGVKETDDGPVGDTGLARLIICKWCSSVWVGGILAILFIPWSDPSWLVFPLALSAGAIVADSIIYGLYNHVAN